MQCWYSCLENFIDLRTKNKIKSWKKPFLEFLFLKHTSRIGNWFNYHNKFFSQLQCQSPNAGAILGCAKSSWKVLEFRSRSVRMLVPREQKENQKQQRFNKSTQPSRLLLETQSFFNWCFFTKAFASLQSISGTQRWAMWEDGSYSWE